MNGMLQCLNMVYTILNLCIGGIDRDELFKKSELSPRQLDKHLEVLLVKQLLTLKRDQLYITPQGHDFLVNYHRAREKNGEQIDTLLRSSSELNVFH